MRTSYQARYASKIKFKQKILKDLFSGEDWAMIPNGSLLGVEDNTDDIDIFINSLGEDFGTSQSLDNTCVLPLIINGLSSMPGWISNEFVSQISELSVYSRPLSNSEVDDYCDAAMAAMGQALCP